MSYEVEYSVTRVPDFWQVDKVHEVVKLFGWLSEKIVEIVVVSGGVGKVGRVMAQVAI